MPNLDELEKRIEREVSEVYSTAQAEIREKWDEYMKYMGDRVNTLYAQHEQAFKSGDMELANDLLYEYQRNVQNMTLQDSRYRAMIRETTGQLAHTNKTALDRVNGRMGQVYTLAYNELEQDIKGAKLGGYSFTLVDQKTVDELIDNGGSLLPEPSKKTLKEILQKSLDYGKDMTWNKKVLNSQILQGILQGESIGKIAERLQRVTDMNRASAVRNARTMMTNARNKGKQDSIRQAADDGVILKRVWKSQHDERVRVEHLSADGQERDTNEPFDIGGYPLMYPGDRSGPPRLVYNCRCRLGTRIVGFKNESGNGATYLSQSAGGGAVGAGAAASRDAQDFKTDFKSLKWSAVKDLEYGFEAFPEGDVLKDWVRRVEPYYDEKGIRYYDIAMHGTEDGLCLGTKIANISAKDLGNYILHRSDYDGAPVRLLCCSSGKKLAESITCFAEELATKLGCNVRAPNMLLYFDKHGTLRVGRHDEGAFATYGPNSIRRYK